MAIVVPTSVVLAIDGYAVTSNVNKIDFGLQVATIDATTFGSGQFTQSVPGLKTLVATVEGFNDYATGGLDEFARSEFVSVVPSVVSLAPVGDTAGNLGYGVRCLDIQYQPFDAALGQIAKFNFALDPSGAPGIAQGLVTSSTATPISATGHTTPVQVGAITSPQTMYAFVHVLSISGTASPSIQFQLESAATSGGAYTLRGSAGTAITATGVSGGQMLSTTTVTTDSWWKLAVTVTGTTPSFTVLAVIARA
jgi:hypothetical protein